ncbi:MAG: carbohydrate binding domain-containing protein, partial [Bacillota bacterium]
MNPNVRKGIISGFITVLAFSLAFVFFSAHAANLVQNPGFESGTSSWAVPAHFSVVSDDKHSGTYSVKLTGTGDWCNLIQGVSLAGSTNYTLTAWGKCGASQIIKVVNGSTWAVIATLNTTANNTWTQYTLNFNSGSNTSVNVVVTDNASGTSYYDDFYLDVAGAASPTNTPTNTPTATIVNTPTNTPTPTPTPTQSSQPGTVTAK